MISVRDVHKRFGPIRAVNGLTVDIARGEIVGFLGPNGAGKTTAMRLITGFYTPDSGGISVDGIDVVKDPLDAQRRIGYLPENNPMYRDMLVAEFLAMSAELKGLGRSERAEAFDFVVDAVGIDDVFYRPLGQLSKGYKQRVGIAMALVHRPALLILDEPTEGLDPIQRAEIRSLIKELASEHTIVMSTHVMQEVHAVASRVLIVSGGQLVADGTAEELTRAASGDRVLMLDVEGPKVAASLRGLDGVEQVEITPGEGERVTAAIVLAGDAEIRPEVSQLAREHAWTIWSLREQEQQLEDVFYELTRDA
jgi:ABC-2 type transport system ATP-binding protein